MKKYVSLKKKYGEVENYGSNTFPMHQTSPNNQCRCTYKILIL